MVSTRYSLAQWETLFEHVPKDTLLDLAVDAAGDLFALENTPDGKYDTQVVEVASQGQALPMGVPFFPNGDLTDTCGNTTPGVSGSLSKDGSEFIYFVDQNGGRINKYDPTAPTWVGCTPPPSNGFVYLPPKAQTFTTVASSTFPVFDMAADDTGNLYLTSMPFSLVQELPRAYVWGRHSACRSSATGCWQRRAAAC